MEVEIFDLLNAVRGPVKARFKAIVYIRNGNERIPYKEVWGDNEILIKGQIGTEMLNDVSSALSKATVNIAK